MDWTVYFQSIMSSHEFPSQDDSFIVTAPMYFEKLTYILNKRMADPDGIEIIENFLKWRIIESLEPLLTIKFRQAKSDLVHKLQGMKIRFVSLTLKLCVPENVSNVLFKSIFVL